MCFLLYAWSHGPTVRSFRLRRHVSECSLLRVKLCLFVNGE